ncbi:ubiquitin [Clostridium baratii]|uniref:ubiquitin n=1 Tax=Clostridium baratii TaxID=1561 RepID=UPI0030D0FBC0
MSKLIKTTNTDIEVKAIEIKVVEIEDYSFELDEKIPCVDVYYYSDKGKVFVEAIVEEVKEIVSIKDLKRIALNWFFNNVEIVKEIEDQ